MPHLLVYAPPSASGSAPSSEWAWVEASGDDGQVRQQGMATPALFPGQGEVTVLLPAAAVSWHRVTLPPGSLSNAARLRALLGGLLEEQLLDEPEQLHFALQPGARAGAPNWVAVCRKDWLQFLVQTLESAGRRLGRLVPEFTPSADAADSLPSLFATGPASSPQLTVCDGQGVLTLPLNVGSLALALPARLPEGSRVTSEPAVAELAEQVLGQSLPIVSTATRWLEAARSPWDLAQFEFASTGRARAGKQLRALGQSLWRDPQWRAARWGAALLVLAQLVGLNAWAWKEQQALQAKRAAISQALTQTFPAVKYVSDQPVTQMQREVAALQQATGALVAADLEPMLAALAQSLSNARTPSSIDFAAGQLRLRGLQLSPSEQQTLQAQLRTRGYSARSEGDLLLLQPEAAP